MTRHTVDDWRAFISRVEIRGPIPIKLEFVAPSHAIDAGWTFGTLHLHACVPDRETGADVDLSFSRAIPLHDVETMEQFTFRLLRELYLHEAAEAFLVDGVRTRDPHASTDDLRIDFRGQFIYQGEKY